MSRPLLFTALLALLSMAAQAQAQDPHAGHKIPPPAAAADPHAGHVMPAPPAPAADPHADHATPTAPGNSDPHLGHAMPTIDPHAGHMMSAPAAGAQLPVGAAPAPPAATDHLADNLYGRARMDQARAVLRQEHGGMTLSRTMIDRLEVRPASGRDAYAWEGEFRYGGDIDRMVIKSEGEGVRGDLEDAEVEVLYSHAIGPYFDLQAGVRQDIEPRPRRTYAVVGFEGLAPYWFEVEGALFLSNKGDLSARLEGSYDLRLTQRLILEPRGEVNLAAEDARALGVGSGLSKIEVGLRLRYEIERQFAPYVGVNLERRLGRTADFARAAGEDVSDARFVFGLRAWF